MNEEDNRNDNVSSLSRSRTHVSMNRVGTRFRSCAPVVHYTGWNGPTMSPNHMFEKQDRGGVERGWVDGALRARGRRLPGAVRGSGEMDRLAERGRARAHR